MNLTRRRRIRQYAAGVVLTWPLITGMMLRDIESIGFQYWPPAKARERMDLSFRHDLGAAVAMGAFFSVMWPVGLPMAYCLSGFAEHGIWTYR